MERLCGVRTALLALVSLLLGCPPIMVEREGHRVFNPFYLPYLDSSERDAWQRPERVLDALALAPDGVVADIGAGSGYFTERFARRLGEGGLVYATDVQQEMLERLHERVADAALPNVVVVAAEFDDPSLPEACCDLVFFSSVYKEIDSRVAYMEKVGRLLRPGGRVAILEFRPEAEGPGTPRADRLPPERVIEELAAAGFELREQHFFLPRQYFLVFTPAGAPPRRASAGGARGEQQQWQRKSQIEVEAVGTGPPSPCRGPPSLACDPSRGPTLRSASPRCAAASRPCSLRVGRLSSRPPSLCRGPPSLACGSLRVGRLSSRPPSGRRRDPAPPRRRASARGCGRRPSRRGSDGDRAPAKS